MSVSRGIISGCKKKSNHFLIPPNTVFWCEGKAKIVSYRTKTKSLVSPWPVFFYGSRESPKIEPEHIFMLVKYIISLLSHVVHIVGGFIHVCLICSHVFGEDALFSLISCDQLGGETPCEF